MVSCIVTIQCLSHGFDIEDGGEVARSGCMLKRYSKNDEDDDNITAHTVACALISRVPSTFR